MPDMTEPYAHIQSEIERLKYEIDNANYERNRQEQIVATLTINKMKLESALDKQKEADNSGKI